MGLLRSMFVQPVRRTSVSALLLGVSAFLAVAYAVPGWAVSATLPPGRRSVVAFLDQLGPIWTIAFGLTALLLLYGLRLRRHRVLVFAHLLGVTVTAWWFAALLIGALISDPTGPFVTSMLAFAVTVLHFWSVMDYAADEEDSTLGGTDAT
jgi:hypothetical protein